MDNREASNYWEGCGVWEGWRPWEQREGDGGETRIRVRGGDGGESCFGGDVLGLAD